MDLSVLKGVNKLWGGGKLYYSHFYLFFSKYEKLIFFFLHGCWIILHDTEGGLFDDLSS